MQSPSGLIKYTFKVRTKNGVVVDQLQILAADQIAAERNLKQMYRHCDILNVSVEEKTESVNFEDVLDLIVSD